MSSEHTIRAIRVNTNLLIGGQKHRQLDYTKDIRNNTFAIFRYAAGQGGQQNMLTQ